jgi:hypothetical protein
VPVPGQALAVGVEIIYATPSTGETAAIWLHAVDAKNGADRWEWVFPTSYE